MTETVATRPAGLAEQMRTATREQHERAERSAFVGALTSGGLSAQAYARFAGQLWYVYSALEETADAIGDHPAVGPLLAEELRRLPALEADLAVLSGPGWRSALTPLDATAVYADRIAATRAWPPGFIGHHYTRYLGDLSGGQIMRRMLQREYGLPDAALTFFDFPGIPKPKVFKDRYRALLDAAPLDDAEQRRVTAEARAAFDLNTALFVQLSAETAETGQTA